MTEFGTGLTRILSFEFFTSQPDCTKSSKKSWTEPGFELTTSHLLTNRFDHSATNFYGECTSMLEM